MSQVLDEAGVRHVARLARIAIPSDRVPALTGELARVLDYMAILERVDAEVPHAEPVAAPWRADEVAESLPREVALGAAQSRTEAAFVVPKVVG